MLSSSLRRTSSLPLAVLLLAALCGCAAHHGDTDRGEGGKSEGTSQPDSASVSSPPAGGPDPSIAAYVAYDRRAAESAKASAIEEEQPAAAAPAPPIETTGDEFESREIVVNDTVHAHRIDSIDNAILLLERETYAGDRRFAKMRDFDVDDKVRYLEHLLQHGLRDTAAVLDVAGKLLRTLELEEEKLRTILESQAGRDRSLVALHVRAHRDKVARVGKFVLGITPKSSPKVKRPKSASSVPR